MSTGYGPGDLTEFGQACADRDMLLRHQEILTDIAFHVGYMWHEVSDAMRNAVMEELEGSRGLRDKLVEWTNDFDVYWETMDASDPRREDYIAEVDNFATERFHTLVATIRLDQ